MCKLFAQNRYLKDLISPKKKDLSQYFADTKEFLDKLKGIIGKVEG